MVGSWDPFRASSTNFFKLDGKKEYILSLHVMSWIHCLSHPKEIWIANCYQMIWISFAQELGSGLLHFCVHVTQKEEYSIKGRQWPLGMWGECYSLPFVADGGLLTFWYAILLSLRCWRCGKPQSSSLAHSVPVGEAGWFVSYLTGKGPSSAWDRQPVAYPLERHHWGKPEEGLPGPVAKKGDCYHCPLVRIQSMPGKRWCGLLVVYYRQVKFLSESFSNAGTVSSHHCPSEQPAQESVSEDSYQMHVTFNCINILKLWLEEDLLL